MQKFKRGDLVRVAEDLGPSMAHFGGKGQEAVIVGSYSDQYGGSDTKSYTLMFTDGGSVSWYDEHQLTFIRHDSDAIARFTKGREERQEKESELAWIIANWSTIRTQPPGASMAALGHMIGLHDLWGPRGEGITYYANVLTLVNLFDDVMKTGDEAKVREFAAMLKR